VNPIFAALLLRPPLCFGAFITPLAVLTLSSCGKPAATFKTPVPTVIVVPATPATPASEEWNGTVRARNEVKLAFPVAGRLSRLTVEVGDRVESGDTLAELDPEPFLLAQRQAEAECQAATVAVAEAERRLASEERLWAERATSRADYDAARSSHAAAVARSKTAEASLALASRQLRESLLTAPFSGRIARRLAQTASWTEPGVTVVELDPEGPAEVVFPAPTSRLAQLGAGRPVDVFANRSGNPATPISGRITHIGQRSLSGGVHEVIVSLPDAAEVFPGEAVRVSLSSASSAPQAGVRLPVTAVQPAGEDGAGFAFVLQPGAPRIERRPVRFQAPHGSEVIVTTGLRAGELAVVSGLPFLRDGQDVQVRQRQ